MLKVKKKIGKTSSVNKNQDEISKIQNELKNSIKKSYLNDQKKKKTIDKYAQLTTQIREEYAKLQHENIQLKIELQKYKTYVYQLPETQTKKYYSKPIRKGKNYHDLQPESEIDESDSFVTEIRRRRPRKQKRKIIYEDKLDVFQITNRNLQVKKSKKKIIKLIKKKTRKNNWNTKKKIEKNYKINKNVKFN